jgi:hypothetical protein
MNSNDSNTVIFPDYQDDRWTEETNKDEYNKQQRLRTYVRVFNSREGRYYLIHVLRRHTYFADAEIDYSKAYKQFIKDCYITQNMTDFSQIGKIIDMSGFSPFILDENQDPELIRIRKNLLKQPKL